MSELVVLCSSIPMISLPHDTSPPALVSPNILSPTPDPDPPGSPLSGRIPSPPLPLESNAAFLAAPDTLQDIYFDDEGLSSLERIYLFARSRAVTHRAFISRSLHTFLPDVSPLEAVEYVLPLLNALAVDEEELVKEALVSNIVPAMWWFFENCQLVEEEPPPESHDPPLLPVQTFTPILGSLLIDYNKMICGPARFAVVDILNRLRAADTDNQDNKPFGPTERKLLEHEIIQQVIIGMGRLDVSEDSSPPPPVWPSPGASSHSLNISPPPLSSQAPLTPPSSSQTPLTPPVPALSPTTLSSTPDSSIGPISPPSEDQPNVALASPSPREPFLDWVPPSPPEPTLDAKEDWATSEGNDEEANQQAAVGRWSSMSLIATVTANATLPEDTIRAFADEVAYISGDPFYWVRREVSFAVGALAKVIPAELVTLTLLPLFDALTHDTVWHVRHSAIYALPSLLARLPPQHRRALALDTLLPLTTDVAPTVRLGVFEVLGEVIYTFHEDEGGPPEELVALFVGGAGDDSRRPLASVFEDSEEPEPAPAAFFREPERPLIASYNYPAVALTLGPARWGELRPYYIALTRDANPRVRRTLAAGLGEMARILGAAHARADVLDVWEDMVHDAADAQVRLKALGGVGMLVRALGGEGVVGGLVELWERWLTGWRERECLAGALPALAEVAGEVVRTLLGRALVDNVAAVREAAIDAVAPVLRAFEDRPHLAEALRDDLQGLACADSCRRRATYVACYRALIEGGHGEAEVRSTVFMEHVVLLSRDRIVDVRIGVARLLGVLCDKFYSDPSARPPRLAEAVRRLGQDASRDVRAFVAYLLVPAGAAKPPESPAQELTVPAFATFSRPPPKSPPVVGAGADAFEADIPEVGEGASSDRSVPLVMQQPRLDDWEPT